MGELTSDELSTGLKKAQDAKAYSYSPYSKFRVGCSLLTQEGVYIPGSNVENASYGLTVCAERSALCSAVSQGHNKFKAIFISTDVTTEPVGPCGACRQFISEFGPMTVVYTNATQSPVITKQISDLLPHSFSCRDMGMQIS